MKQSWRFVRSGGCTAAWNMAVDEAMYTLAALGVSPPTPDSFGHPRVSIGAFRNIRCLEHWFFRNRVHWLRRLTEDCCVHEGLSYSMSAHQEYDVADDSSRANQQPPVPDAGV